MADFATVKEYVLDLGLAIAEEIPEEEIIIVNDEERGVQNLVVDCEDTLLVIEQLILQIAAGTADTYQRILQMNRDLVFGAFVLNEGGDSLLYRNTLALENLDLNELESTINSLSLGLAEHGEELLGFAAK
ncbi:MAG: YbjN domain-containing protein [Gemmatimonadetes bacterium]|nr:YbjN domain-containing protein [Gemmatimonadota bacterium]MYC72194.1 YbjN domain-containing protein [Gemmatimonadota bacterium]MYI62227.1 YbjN domain-containing protein [Gemmatimonadota bacterium]